MYGIWNNVKRHWVAVDGHRAEWGSRSHADDALRSWFNNSINYSVRKLPS